MLVPQPHLEDGVLKTLQSAKGRRSLAMLGINHYRAG